MQHVFPGDLVETSKIVLRELPVSFRSVRWMYSPELKSRSLNCVVIGVTEDSDNRFYPDKIITLLTSEGRVAWVTDRDVDMILER